jgi:hypothetical protein
MPMLNTKHCVADAMNAYYGRDNEALMRLVEKMAREIDTLRAAAEQPAEPPEDKST